ncbi:MAG: ATP-dependent protease [Parcubacteria bacterium 32_520]|nr:MAG: ATP-dependent protease [Parcubacteria bacterium 32_520]
MEILTGRKAGARQKNGKFEENTINDLVDQKLLEFAIKLKEFGEEKKQK